MSIFFKRPNPYRGSGVGSDASPLDRAEYRRMSEAERAARKLRFELFDPQAINDAAWVIMLDLFTAHLDGTKMLRTKSICADDPTMPATTVTRYLDHLVKFGVVERQDDPDDHRVRLVGLSDAGKFWMEEYFSLLHDRNG